MTLGWISSLNPYRTPDTREERGAELVTAEGTHLPLRSAVLHVEAGGGIARAVLEQEFTNDSDDVLRVTYKMPLPADGAVSGYAFTVGARTITGKVDKKQRARERFEEALAKGQTAALLEQDRADIFTQDIGNIPPRTSIKARITVDMKLAWLPEGEWELRFPTVIGPRYMGAEVTAAQAKASATSHAEGDVGARVHLEVKVGDRISAGRKVESPSHALSERGDVHELAALAGARLDRDIVLRWAVTRPEVGVSMRTATKDGKTYGLVTIVPPSAESRIAAQPRDLVVLLDTSGSMGGTPLSSAKMLIASMIQSLGPADRLELVEFSSAPRRWKTEPVPASDGAKRDALAWLKKLEAGGATEMLTAVLEALRTLRPGAQRQVVLVTDGYIGGEEQIVATLKDRLPEGCRFHFVGVGSAPNRSLATAMARAGRGAEILVAPGEDAERGAARLLAKTNAPVLTDVIVEGAASASRFLPDVFAGSPVLVAVDLGSARDVVVRGKLAHGAWQQRVRAPEPDEDAAIPALFARERVADLEVIGLGTNEQDREIEAIGLRFQIATRMTSWVAVDEDPSVDPYAPSRHVEVPQEIPYGTSFASFGLSPSTLTGGGVPTMLAMMGAPMAAPAMPMQAGYGAPPPAGRPSMQRARSELPRDLPYPQTALPAPAKKARSRASLFVFLFLLLLVLGVIAWFFFR